MRFLEKLYRTGFGRGLSAAARLLAWPQRPFMVYGYRDRKKNSFRKYTRISSTAVIMNRKELAIGDSVWVWHYSILDATEGLEIEDGCQIGAWVGIFTHGSEHAIRLLGSSFVHIPNTERKGYTRGPVKIGAYTYIGAHAIVLPGVTIGRGCLVGAGSLITKDVPDYAIVTGNPARLRGSTIDLDRRAFYSWDHSETYYDKGALEIIKSHRPADRRPEGDR
jgi:acetyltransferase-like isoleucine patch superfamily enzyme